MPFLARKVSLAKWQPNSDLAKEEISADAVTSDLRTLGNTLSLWACSSAEKNELEEIALALASSAERLDKIDLAWIDQSQLESEGISLVASTGRTPVQNCQQRHRDAVRLDLARLGKVAGQVAQAVREKGQWRRFSTREVLNLIKKAINDRRIGPDQLSSELKQEVKAMMKKN